MPHLNTDAAQAPPSTQTGDVPPIWIRSQRRVGSGAGVRRYRRHEWEASVAVELENPGTAGFAKRRVRVMTRDLSAAGFAFVFDRPVPLGAIVRARFDALPSTPSVIGTVRHCMACAGSAQYRIGVEIVETVQ